jgi:hypothetical protein
MPSSAGEHPHGRRGRGRPARRRHRRRRRAFELALAEGESGEALEGLAKALYLEREDAAAAAHCERAYAAYRRERNPAAAGRPPPAGRR